ncbi:DUF4181 domain-containing protein [Gracilibacillus sp. Marseille-QA3620]
MERLIVRLFTIIVILFLVIFVIEKMTEKFLGVKTKKISETPGKRVDRWGRTIIVVIFLCSLPIVTQYSEIVINISWILFIASLMTFQVILEWRYLKESKQYISTLISSTIIISIFSYYLLLLRNI